MAAITKVTNHYPEALASMRKGIEAAISETANAILADVQGGPHAAPMRTGNLRSSFSVSEDFEGSSPYAEVGNDPDIADYAEFVEAGTSRMAAQPYLTPSTEAQREAHEERIAAALRGAHGFGALGGHVTYFESSGSDDGGSGSGPSAGDIVGGLLNGFSWLLDIVDLFEL